LLVDDGRLVQGAHELVAALADEPFVEVHPEDARSLGLQDGSTVRITTPAGTAQLPLRVTPAVARGVAFVPFAQAGFAANTLLSGAFHTTARIEAAEAAETAEPQGGADDAPETAAVGSGG
jgi:anaerobic selenocysteine-containing dehydrogenase